MRHLRAVQVHDRPYLRLVLFRAADRVIHWQEMRRRQRVFPDHVERHACVRLDGRAGVVAVVSPQLGGREVAMQRVRAAGHADAQRIAGGGAMHRRPWQGVDEGREPGGIHQARHARGVAHGVHAQRVAHLAIGGVLHRVHVVREQPRRDPSRRGPQPRPLQEAATINHAWG
jgi:hypothetical protein